MQHQRPWLPNPPDGTAICLGFDGSINNDTTGIRAETMTGHAFTPRWGPDRDRPTFWDPKQHGDRPGPNRIGRHRSTPSSPPMNSKDWDRRWARSA